MSVAKVDGFGVRSLGNGYLANQEERKRFVRMFAAEALAKGDLVAMDFASGAVAATEPTNGWGSTVKKANTGVLGGHIACGIATETIASGDIGTIQVYGYCDFAKLSTGTLSDSNIGSLVCSRDEAGELDLLDHSGAIGAAAHKR